MPYVYQGRLDVQTVMSSLGWQLRLYTNSGTLTLATVLADLVEPTFPNYAPIPLAWTTPALNGSNESQMQLTASNTFTQVGSGGGDLVYGAFLVRSYSGTAVALYDWKAFSSPILFNFSGQSATVAGWTWKNGPL